jgi:hypothetical protein
VHLQPLQVGQYIKVDDDDQTDITQAFTYGELDPGVEIYCYIPDGLPSVSDNKVLKLERSVYCLKQVSAAVIDKLTCFFKSKNL